MSNFNERRFGYTCFYPIIALRAHGDLGRLFIFKEYWYGRRVDPYYEPTQPRTGKQQGNKSLIADAVKIWQGFDIPTQQYYNKMQKGKKITGYQKWCKDYLNAFKPMIIYWGPLLKSAADSDTPDVYMSSIKFQGAQRLKSLSVYPAYAPYGTSFYHSVLDKYFFYQTAGWQSLGAGASTDYLGAQVFS